MDITKIGVIGVGVMGSMLALLFAEKGLEVALYDRSEENLHKATKNAKKAGLAARVHACQDYESLCEQLGSPKLFIFSLPHGSPGDSVVRMLRPYLSRRNIVIDGSNENYLVTQERQAVLQPRGVSYIGMGVSGGFSGARYGPFLMPGGDEWAIDRLLSLLSKIAANDEQNRPCVAKVGSGGSAHYVKMIHNGIEHGMMSVLCEAWELMDQCLGMDGDHIAAVFEAWCSEGELDIRDAVVQDANDSEETGVWANLEAIKAHVPTPSLSAAHYLRLASSDILLRDSIKISLGTATPVCIDMEVAQRAAFLENLRRAVYVSILACFVQGLDLLARVNAREGWGIKIQNVARIWRAGCVIKSDHITDLFEHHYGRYPGDHPLCGKEIFGEVKRCWPSLK